MKKESNSVLLAIILGIACIVFRLLGGVYPNFIPNISPLLALSYVGAMALPRRWGWMVGPGILIFSDLAFLKVNEFFEGSMLSWWTLISIGFYFGVVLLGMFIARHKSLPRILAGCVLSSVLFYVVSNTFSWWTYIIPKMDPGYPGTLAGWWQANTIGLAGINPPTWVFLRNAMAGDLFFTILFLFVLDRAVLLNPFHAKSKLRAA